MTSWLLHPRYVPVRDALVERLRSPHYRFRRLNPVVFLCGGHTSPTRERLKGYITRKYPATYVFYAEAVWDELSANATLSALDMEDQLAALADLVIVIVESPGTFTELGAFSISAPLRRKLLAICDPKHRGSESFIETGPLRWIDAESAFKPAIWVPHARILEAADEISDRLEKIPKGKTSRLETLADNPKHLLFFVCDLVAVIQPATEDIVAFYLERIVGPQRPGAVASLLGLAMTMGLLLAQEVTIKGRSVRVFHPDPDPGLRMPFHHRRRLDLPTERARHVSVLQTIPEALLALEATVTRA